MKRFILFLSGCFLEKVGSAGWDMIYRAAESPNLLTKAVKPSRRMGRFYSEATSGHIHIDTLPVAKSPPISMILEDPVACGAPILTQNSVIGVHRI